MMEAEQSVIAGGERGLIIHDEEVKKEKLSSEEDEDAAADTEEEDEDALPHSEILDIFEEGLARLVQDPLLCDLPIQVSWFLVAALPNQSKRSRIFLITQREQFTCKVRIV
ncbi:hypothetical protein AMECASPLE_036902 [Ameca splendens]|uniref:Uncharacterized protein n=1 Tax=Ameca splendens TaxID=208324 RepID=A0ABV0XWL9_9TELE